MIFYKYRYKNLFKSLKSLLIEGYSFFSDDKTNLFEVILLQAVYFAQIASNSFWRILFSNFDFDLVATEIELYDELNWLFGLLSIKKFWWIDIFLPKFVVVLACRFMLPKLLLNSLFFVTNFHPVDWLLEPIYRPTSFIIARRPKPIIVDLRLKSTLV